MKLYKYNEIQRMGEVPKSGTLLDLIASIPYLLINSRLPPKIVIDNILATGLIDAGMSGGSSWQPFQINDEEFSILKKQATDAGLIISEPPEWVDTLSKFHIWELEIDRGVPADEHLKLESKYENAIKKYEEAESSNVSEEEIERLHLESIEAGFKLSDFINKHLS